MRLRRIATIAASAALIGAAAFTTTGCSLISHQATEIAYNPSDGVGVNVGDIDVRNAIVFSDDGVDGNLVLAAVNTGSSDALVKIEYGTGSPKQSVTLAVPAGETVSLGSDGDSAAAPLFLPGIDTQPGAMIELHFSVAGAESALLEVPVLTGELDYYSGLVPSESPSPAVSTSPRPSLSPTP